MLEATQSKTGRSVVTQEEKMVSLITEEVSSLSRLRKRDKTDVHTKMQKQEDFIVDLEDRLDTVSAKTELCMRVLPMLSEIL